MAGGGASVYCGRLTAMILFSSRRRGERDAAESVYAAAVAASRRPEMFLTYGVEDTLQGRFEMLSLHLFPLVHRLMVDPGDDAGMARLVSEVLVTDMDGAFREMGVGDLTVPKRMKTLYRSFAGRMAAYSAAMAAGGDELSRAIGRNVDPDGRCDLHADALSRYLRRTTAGFRAASLEELRRGNLPYPEAMLAAETPAR
jgi:cytochrome b pre-mRNA-processing protein 3